MIQTKIMVARTMQSQQQQHVHAGGHLECSPACQKGVDHEHQVGGLLANGSAKVMIPPVVDQQQLSQARSEDGHAEQGAIEDERQKEPVIPLHQHTTNMRALQHMVETSAVLPDRCDDVPVAGKQSSSKPLFTSPSNFDDQAHFDTDN